VLPYLTIRSKENSLIKQVIKLAQNSSYRKQFGQAVVYGEHLVEEALKNNCLHSLLIAEERWDRYQTLLAGLATDKIYLVPKAIMSKMSLLDTPTDIIGLITTVTMPVTSAVYTNDCILLENIQDPGNLGTIMRAAKASGINTIVLSGNSVDVYNSKVLRASQGAQFGLTILTQADLTKFIQLYRGQVIATTPYATISIYQLKLTQPVAWVFGNEGQGISAELLQQIKIQAKIPMLGNAESLNIAMAATVCIFETVRQRLQ
jgi:TrmH family RNA methyltransferase